MGELFTSGYQRQSDFDDTDFYTALTGIGYATNSYQQCQGQPQRPGFNIQCNGDYKARFGFCNNCPLATICLSDDTSDADGVAGIGLSGPDQMVLNEDGSLTKQQGAGTSPEFAPGEGICAPQQIDTIAAWVYVDTYHGDLIMKIGRTPLFGFASSYWENDNLYNADADSTTAEDAKFQAFNDKSFNKITVCYKEANANCWSYTWTDGTIWNNAIQLFTSGYQRQSDFDDTDFYAALTGIGYSTNSYQQCQGQPQRPGFNIQCNGDYKARFGFCNNCPLETICQPDDSSDADGVAGIGLSGPNQMVLNEDGSLTKQQGAGTSPEFAPGEGICTPQQIDTIAAWVYVNLI